LFRLFVAGYSLLQRLLPCPFVGLLLTLLDKETGSRLTIILISFVQNKGVQDLQLIPVYKDE
jgi:hypothetical protein